jgi:excisionase family DNA binding protein
MTRLDSSATLTTTQVAELLAVHPSTVKRWCNEGELAVHRTVGGHRRIDLHDALTLARERKIASFLHAFAPDEHAVWIAVDHLLETGDFAPVHALAMDWLAAGQMRLLGELFYVLGRHPRIAFTDFCDVGVKGFMTRVGESWRSGRLCVAEEHMVSETLVEALLRLRRLAGPSRAGADGEPPHAVVGVMAGDRHQLGAQCVRLLLERRAWQVSFVGADVPVEDFAAVQRARAARLVCVSFAPPSTAADMQRCVRILSEFYDRAAPYTLALGGNVGEPAALAGLPRPFRELAVFGSAASFSDALDGGFAVSGRQGGSA